MMVDNLGHNIIFLISQPRSGSTLLQHILGNHPKVHTVSEPWVMLHPLYALRSSGHQAEYDASVAQRALQEFLKGLPAGEQDYFQGLRQMYGYLYQQALTESGRPYFLDKTPRYYLILPELRRLFPEAHFIFLLRNPLVILISILNTWVKEKWTALYRFRQDLVLAPRLLTEGINSFGVAGVVTRYEDLVKNPEQEVRRICETLELDFNPEMVTYGRSDLPSWSLGDRRNVNRYTQPTAVLTEKWQTALADPQVWRLAHDYLELLGDDLISTMGYSGADLKNILKASRPPLTRLTASFAWLTNKTADQRTPLERQSVRVMRFFHRRLRPKSVG